MRILYPAVKRFRLVVAVLMAVSGFAVYAGEAAARHLNISDAYSPLNDRRPLRPETRYIILHTTEGNLQGSLRKIRQYGEAHYLVTPSGEVFRIIHHTKIATHSGRSMWEGRSTIDNYSIGIEVVGFHDRDITEAQYTALRELLRQLKSIYRIQDENVLSHSMVAYGRPNRFHPNQHRGRKRCGMIFAHPDVRRRLGLAAAPARCPDVTAGRLVVADPELHRYLYQPPVALAATPSKDPMVIARGVSAWSVARDRYDDPATVYIYPDGRRFRGNEIRQWENIPAGTRVLLLEGEQEREQEFEGFLEIGRDGLTAKVLAGELYADATTIYFFPDGLIRTGAELSRTPAFRRLLSSPPKGTRVLVGYVYCGYVQPNRPPSRIAGRRWNYPSTFYRLPDGRILSGDEIDDRAIPLRTLVFMLR